MNSEELKKSEIELEEEERNNNEQIDIIDERFEVSKINGFEHKCSFIFAVSAISLISLIFATSILIKTYGITIITSSFPGLSYPIALIGSSLGLGVLVRHLYEKSYQIKERLKNFSSAKTKTEQFEEEIRYQIEFEKAINRNMVIEETRKVRNQSRKLSVISNSNSLFEQQTKEGLESKIESITAFIQEEYDKLDIITAKKVLHDRFWKMRSQSHRISENIMVTILGAALAMIAATSPTEVFTAITNGSSLFQLLTTMLTPFAIGAGTSVAYLIKKNKIYRKVFSDLNKELCQNSLVEDFNQHYAGIDSDEFYLEEEIERQIKRIGTSKFQLQNAKRNLESLISTENNKGIISQQTIKEKTEVHKLIAPTHNQEETTKENDNVLRLVKRKKPPKKQGEQ